jgi:hypothetical protein
VKYSLVSKAGQLLRLEFTDQWLNNFIERTFHYFTQFIQSKIDPVIGDPSLRKVVGANTLGAIAATNQTFALVRLLFSDSLILRGISTSL